MAMAANTLSFSPISLPSSQSPNTKRNQASPSLPSSSSIYGCKLSIVLLNSSRFVPKYRCSTSATVTSSLPSAVKREGVSSERIPKSVHDKWSARSIRSFAMAELEARKLKYPNTGTESLLMGILVEGTSTAAKFLRANGITLFKVREESVNLLGRSDLYIFSAEHPPLTEPAQRVLDWAINEKMKSGDSGEITTAYLLLGIWSEKDSAGQLILATLGFNDEKAKEVAKSMNEDINLSFK
ncbi:hypothetical protein Dsin_014888 [Dipteronia sinensis]|uniref:Clp R domain-containing protein n=1 Tax=Dipteronia sinensis TaxID=43782 RepID=A0AAE0AMT0_9ROSI|nr:hypothetical protein Dsin_014888 [Dipteronia sinensis]